MIQEELPRAQIFLRETLQNEVLSAMEMLERRKELKKRHISPITLQYAIWRLIDQGEIEFTVDRRIRLCKA
jgi:hypothetical protein